MELLHRQLSRFAVFEAESESEALSLLQQASGQVYEHPARLVGFNDDGFLVAMESPEGDEGWGEQGQGGALEEQEDETIHFARAAGGKHLLSIELYDDVTDQGDPLFTDNIMLARHLERLCVEGSQAK